MVFADLIFLYCFLPLNLIFYYMSGNKLWRNIVLVAFSLFFYAWGEPVWIILLIFSATIDYFHGLMVEANRGNVKAKLAVASSVVVNLGLLGIFKYSGLLYETINSVFGLSLKVPTFALPIGISFYTFQTISYVIDVYRGEAAAQRSYLKFLMYVSLYPQLVAGPIVRYRDVETEINVRTETLAGISRGMSRFCVGLLKKTLIANFAGSLSAGFLGGDLNNLSVLGAWYGIALYAIQIYYDFSGYSDMAIGLANMFGFHYLENFNYPYVSRSATEFWRRWHISLGTFFREYLYIPLGGNRNMMIRNLLVTWFLTGLWHGASWNFVVWGLFWGMLILIEKLFLSRVLECVPRIFSHLYLLAAMLVRASSTGKEEVVFSPEDREEAGRAAVSRANDLLARAAAPELPLGDGAVASFLNKVAANVSAFAQGTAMLTLSEETRPMQGGFILKNGRIEVNCTFDAMIRSEREQTAGAVAKLLFPET